MIEPRLVSWIASEAEIGDAGQGIKAHRDMCGCNVRRVGVLRRFVCTAGGCTRGVYDPTRPLRSATRAEQIRVLASIVSPPLVAMASPVRRHSHKIRPTAYRVTIDLSFTIGTDAHCRSWAVCSREY